MVKKYREGVFIVVYAKTRQGIEFLLLRRRLHWRGWEFPKGGINGEEHIRKAVKRELKEETGLNIIKLSKYATKGKYPYKEELADRQGIIGQTFSLYAAQVQKKPVKIDKQEHSDYRWEEFQNAYKLLKWSNQKECLRVVYTSLIKGKMKYREIQINKKIALLGKNQKQNESLVKEFIGKNNIIMHTVARGSPFGIALEELDENEKKQLASWVARYSQDWRDHHSNVKVHSFTGRKVYKEKSMDVGTFGVKSARTITAKKKDIQKCRKQ